MLANRMDKKLPRGLLLGLVLDGVREEQRHGLLLERVHEEERRRY